MNKDKSIKDLKKRNDQLAYQYRMRDIRRITLENRIERYEQQIDQLTNNWNELRQHIKEYLEEWENSEDEWTKGRCDMARDILYDMEEIKEGKNVSDRD